MLYYIAAFGWSAESKLKLLLEQQQQHSFPEWTLFTADMLTCNRAGETNCVNDGSVPLSVPVSHNSEPAFTKPRVLDLAHLNVINVSNCYCAFPVMT